MKLIDVYINPRTVYLLYELLLERESHQCISHKEMPSMAQHLAFMRSKPYLAWYLIEHDGQIIGATYLSKQREIGIFLFKAHQMKGYGAKAVQLLMEAHPGRFLANIAPTNPGSSEFFQNLGFKHIQNTYELEQS